MGKPGQIRGLEEQLGLTPAARLRLGISLIASSRVGATESGGH